MKAFARDFIQKMTFNKFNKDKPIKVFKFVGNNIDDP